MTWNDDDKAKRELLRKIVVTFFEVAAIIFVVWMLILAVQNIGISEAYAEENMEGLTEAYILCADFVNIRPFPNNNNEELGRFETGDVIYLDGKKKNGYLHCVNLLLEAADGWVNKGYVVYDKPVKVNQQAVIVSKGRLAARKCVNGKRTRWLKSGAFLLVYYWSDEWCVTNCGYVKTKFLDLVGE